jgi:two-component system, NtrC family, sensor histidine kinase HydH
MNKPMKRVRMGRRAQRVWLASTFVLGASLIGSSWVNHRRVADAASSLSHGQGEDLIDHVRQRLAESPADAMPVDSILEQRRDAGLRYIGVVNSQHEYIAEAGEALGDRHQFPEGPSRGSDFIDVGGRYRTWDVVPRRPTGPPQPDSTGRREPNRGRPPLVFIEYEPVIATQLEREAQRAFLLSAVVTAFLLAIAVGFWRLTTRHEAAQLRLEQQERLGMLGEMSAVLAHEIRNPLASLKGNAQLLAERLAEDSSDRRKADRIVQEAQRLEALTSDLLDFARSGPIEMQPADPAAVLEASVQEVDPEAFEVSVTGAPASWPMDANRMRQALTNVLRNARQATPAGTRSEASVEQKNGSLVFSIRDFGPGIPAGEEKRIFSPFYTTRTSGTGLGLAVAQRVAEIHSGTVAASNHPGGGAVFRITLPQR